MANININRNVTDLFYRYKMPKIIVKVEGRGNGIKTRIVNMSDIAKALDRPPSYTTKYFGCELGTQTTIDHKTDKYIVNGSHTSEKMQDILDGFIQKFVLCPKCENPETTLTVVRQTINQKCMACGYAGVLKIVHRLTQYIQKNPPPLTNVTAVANNENGADKKELRKTKGKKGNKKDGESDEEKGQAGDNIIAQNYQDAADRNREQDSPPPAEENSDEEWAADEDEEVTTDGMVAGSEQDEIGKQLSSLTVSSGESEKSHAEKLEAFFTFVEDLKNNDNISLHHKELLAEAERLDITDKATYVLTEVLLDEDILKQLTAYRNIFLRFCHQNPRSQRNLLHAMEMLICQRFPNTLLPKTAHVLKALYDTDIVDETVLIEWHDKSSKKRLGKELSQQLHNKAEPFIKWLKEAEEGDDEEESDEDEGPELELEFSHQATAGLKETKEAPADIDDDDLDIDNI